MTLALANSLTWPKTAHFPYLPTFPLQWEIPPYRGPPNREPHSYFCFTAVFLTPHIQSVTNRYHSFFANISWIHPFPFHSHSCGLSLSRLWPWPTGTLQPSSVSPSTFKYQTPACFHNTNKLFFFPVYVFDWSIHSLWASLRLPTALWTGF